jgi:FMN reductase
VSGPRIVSVVGNPRPASRTHEIARALSDAVAHELGSDAVGTVDLATLGARTFAAQDSTAISAVNEVLAADILIVASPTYKGTYTGLLKVFLDRIGAGALNGARAVPVLLGGAPNHQLAVDVHFAPLLLELGASLPARGLFVLESELPEFPATAAAWAKRHAVALNPARTEV